MLPTEKPAPGSGMRGELIGLFRNTPPPFGICGKTSKSPTFRSPPTRVLPSGSRRSLSLPASRSLMKIASTSAAPKTVNLSPLPTSVRSPSSSTVPLVTPALTLPLIGPFSMPNSPSINTKPSL